MLKVTVGDVDVGTYKETIDWWKVAAGEQAANHQTWSWSSYATVSGSGVSIEATPIDGLWLSAGMVGGAGETFASLTFDDKENETYLAWGVAAKYDLTGLVNLPLNTAVSYRDAGKDDLKIAAVGAEYGNRWGDGFYGFLNVRFRFEKETFKNVDYKDESKTTSIINMNKVALSAIAFDNMVKYQAGAFTVMARIPVTLRGFIKPDMPYTELAANGLTKAQVDSAVAEMDPSWMSYEIKVTYPINIFTLYFDIENDNAVTFNNDFAEKFLKMTVKPGVSFNIGTCSLDVGLNVAIPNTKDTNLAWSVPFSARVSF